jgi:hypothetical protein
VERQAQRVQTAQSSRLSACSAGATQECTNLTATFQSEDGLYRQLRSRYDACRQRSFASYRFSRYGSTGYGGGLFDPLTFEAEYP